EDTRLDFDAAQNRSDLVGVEVVLRHHALDERLAGTLDSLLVHCLCLCACSERNEDTNTSEDRTTARLHETHAANNFLWPLIAASIPKPAIKVTMDVPPALTSGNGTPTTGRSPDTMPALTKT